MKKKKKKHQEKCNQNMNIFIQFDFLFFFLFVQIALEWRFRFSPYHASIVCEKCVFLMSSIELQYAHLLCGNETTFVEWLWYDACMICIFDIAVAGVVIIIAIVRCHRFHFVNRLQNMNYRWKVQAIFLFLPRSVGKQNKSL